MEEIKIVNYFEGCKYCQLGYCTIEDHFELRDYSQQLVKKYAQAHNTLFSSIQEFWCFHRYSTPVNCCNKRQPYVGIGYICPKCDQKYFDKLFTHPKKDYYEGKDKYKTFCYACLESLFPETPGERVPPDPKYFPKPPTKEEFNDMLGDLLGEEFSNLF